VLQHLTRHHLLELATFAHFGKQITVMGGEDEKDYNLSDVHVLDTGNCCILLYKHYTFGALIEYLCKKGDIYWSEIIISESYQGYPRSSLSICGMN